MSESAEHHVNAFKHVFWYLKSTATQKLRYDTEGALENSVVYSDADWIGDQVDRKSV